MKFAIIIGSTRPNRIGPLIAKWLVGLFEADQTLVRYVHFTMVDLASYPLPPFNEPTPPMMVHDLTQFSDSTVRAWNREISQYDAYILVSPEYHSGIPGALKNAIDFLYQAWTGKPVMIATYGIFGGVQASSQLFQVLGTGCRMKIASVCSQLEFPGRNEEKNNTSPALLQAMSGVIEEETFGSWKNKEKEILAGCHELLVLART